MKVISYALFQGSEEMVFNYYLRGVYFNYRMNRLVYPSFHTWLMTTHELLDNELVVDFISNIAGIDQQAGHDKFHHSSTNSNNERCKLMLSRLEPIWITSATHVLCRDLDAITTYREAQAVNDWLKSGKPIHAILDNPAHGGIMGGMCGFDASFVRNKFKTWDDMVKGANLKNHGTDQNLLNKLFKPELVYWSGRVPHLQDNPLWESELTCRHIGAAGCVDMELLRFFQRFDPNPKWDEFEKRFKNICYWRQ